MRRYSKGSQKTVKGAMRKYKSGKLKSGKGGKTVKNRRQAIAIGLSEARQKGYKVPKLTRKGIPRKGRSKGRIRKGRSSRKR